MKKFLCTAISLLLIFNCLPFSVAFAAELDASLNAEVSEDAYQPILVEDLIGELEGTDDGKTQQLTEQINVIKAVYPQLKTYEDLSEEVSRADFTTMLVQLTAGDSFPLYKGFSDIEEDAETLMACLGYAVEAGMVSKSDNFRPDDAITYHEMIKMAVVACGYDIAAQKMGGWPSGYMGIANRIGLTDFFEKSNGVVSVADAYRLLYNVITVSLLEQTSFGEDEEFEINKGSSILSDRFNVKVVENIVYSNNMTTLTRELDNNNEATVTIGVHSYKNNTGKDLLGYNVRAFLIDENGSDTLISMRKYNNNEVFVKEFSGLNGYTILEETSNGSTKRHNLFKGYSLLLNDIAAPDVKLADYIDRDDVTLRLIDNNRDGLYDVVKLYEWNHTQIGKIDLVNSIIFGKTSSGAGTLLDLSDEDAVFRIFDYNNGKLNEITIEDLKNDDILTFVTSANSKLTTVFRSNISVTGVYNAKDNESITVADKDYKLTQYAKKNYPYIVLGHETTLTLDPTGMVVSLSQTADSYRYGWIVVSGKDNKKLSNVNITVKIFDQDGSMRIYPVAEKIYIDNVPKKAMDFYELERTLEDNRMIKYGVNKDGELNMVDFPSEYKNSIPFAENNPERDSFTQYYSSYLSKKGNGAFGNTFMAETGTIFFSIPTTDRDKEELYQIKSYNNFRNQAITLNAYDMEAGQGPKVILTFSNTPAVRLDEYSSAEIVLDIKYARDENDVYRKQIQTYSGTQYNNYFVRDNVDVSQIRPGDIIRISSYKDEIYDFNIDYSFNTNSIDPGLLPGSGQVKNVYFRGYVYAYGTRMIQIWDTMNVNSPVEIEDIYGIDFREQSAVFVDVYKNQDGTVSEVMARYKPLTEIRDYIHAGAEADFVIARTQEGNYVKKWIYRIID